VAGQHELTTHFRVAAPWPPQGLTLLHAPAGAGDGEKVFMRGLATCAQKEENQQETSWAWASNIEH
jgi:hypothetical protein